MKGGQVWPKDKGKGMRDEGRKIEALVSPLHPSALILSLPAFNPHSQLTLGGGVSEGQPNGFTSSRFNVQSMP